MNKNITNAIEILQNFDYDYDEFGEITEAICLTVEALEKQKSSGWIPCKERLPSEEEYRKTVGTFIVSDKDGDVYTAYFDQARKKWHNRDSLNLSNIIAWQPLPEPFKGGENDKL